MRIAKSLNSRTKEKLSPCKISFHMLHCSGDTEVRKGGQFRRAEGIYIDDGKFGGINQI